MKFIKLLIIMFISLQLAIVNGSSDTTFQPGEVLRDTKVHENPDRRSDVIYKIKKKTKVYIKERSKSWYKVEAKSRDEGWLRLLSVRYLGDPKQGALGEVADFSSEVFNVQRNGPTVTTGVRGLDEETFTDAQPDYLTLDIILARKSDLARVKHFGRQGNLRTKDVKIPKTKSAKKEKK